MSPPESSTTQQPCTRCPPPTNPTPTTTTPTSTTTTSQKTYPLRGQTLCPEHIQAWLLSRLSKRTNTGFHIAGGGRDGVAKILIPLSGGISSLALLWLLDILISARVERTRRAGVEIVGVWVDCDDYDDDDDAVLGESWDRVRERFGGRWRLERVGLGDVFEVDGGLLGDRERLELMRGLKVTGEEVVGGGSGLRGAEILACVLRGLPEASSRTDLLVSLRMRLVTAFARRNGCWIVAWGDSMSRLAEKTLAETAKGRGYSLPWQTGDGETPFGGGGGGIRFMYPFQDLYRKEIELWADVASDPLLVDILGRSRTVKNSSLVSSKHLTIDDLMRRYFQGVEESYPSLVANVVRTSNKLEAPSNSNLGLDPWITCVVCGLAYDSQAGDLDIWEGNQKDGMIDSRNRNVEGLDRRKLCYACDRTMKRAKIVGPT